jgi:hypothetical protein
MQKQVASLQRENQSLGGATGLRGKSNNNNNNNNNDNNNNTIVVSSTSGTSKQRKSAKLVDREARGMESLVKFIADLDGGDQIDEW